MEVQDSTEALRQYFSTLDPDSGAVESIRQAELAADGAMLLMNNPKMALKAMGVPVSAESVVNITMKGRADRSAVEVDSDVALARRIIVIVIHYRNCDADIIIIATR